MQRTILILALLLASCAEPRALQTSGAPADPSPPTAVVLPATVPAPLPTAFASPGLGIYPTAAAPTGERPTHVPGAPIDIGLGGVEVTAMPAVRP
jgi:hypothetical protein